MAVDLSKATPRPWRIQKHTQVDKSFEIQPAGIFVDYDDVDHQEQDANAALIVKAANQYDRLLRVEKLAGELAKGWFDYQADPTPENRLVLDAKVHELKAEIGDLPTGRQG